MIAETANLKNVPWDGYLKYLKPSDRVIKFRQKLFAQTLLLRWVWSYCNITIRLVDVPIRHDASAGESETEVFEDESRISSIKRCLSTGDMSTRPHGMYNVVYVDC